MVLRITIDTNLINARQKLPEMNTLEEMHKKGLVEIVKTDAMDTEMLNGYKKGLEKSQQYREIQGYGVFGHSRYDHAIYSGEDDGGLTQSVVMALFPGKACSELSDNDIKDVMHIQAHITNKCDYFITEDKIILDAAELLKKLGVRIRTPSDLLKDIT